MDLLLYLIEKDQIDIYDIPIARITDQFIRHIEIMQIDHAWTRPASSSPWRPPCWSSR